MLAERITDIVKLCIYIYNYIYSIYIYMWTKIERDRSPGHLLAEGEASISDSVSFMANNKSVFQVNIRIYTILHLNLNPFIHL